MITDSDKVLLDALKKGDQAAMKQLFHIYHASLCATASRMIKKEDESKDIVQEVFLKLWTNREVLDIKSSIQGYLKRAVINTCLNFIEKDKRYFKVELEKADLGAYSNNEIEQKQNLDDLSTDLINALDQLPSRTKAVFTLLRYEEMSYKEAAETLEISTKAVEKEMMKALRLLRISLKKYLCFWIGWIVLELLVV